MVGEDVEDVFGSKVLCLGEVIRRSKEGGGDAFPILWKEKPIESSTLPGDAGCMRTFRPLSTVTPGYQLRISA